MEKKEFHRANLPHFQPPGQQYFVTWSLKDAIPPKALKYYTEKLDILRNQIKFEKQKNQNTELINKLQYDYNILRKKFTKAYEDVLHLKNKSIVDLSKQNSTHIVIETLCYWQNIRLSNYALCVMPNHVHWVFQLLEKDENGKPVRLEDIMQSVKRYSSIQINVLEGLKGAIWHKEY